MNTPPDWYQRVYKSSEFPSSQREYWDRVSDYVIERDGFRCQACRKIAGKSSLSVHHITPRAQGGGDELSNLITLHHHCHDYVEVMAYRNINRIMGCTKGMRKPEIESAGIDIDIPEREAQDPGAPEINQNVEIIICSCGIRHPRRKSAIGSRVIEISCACGLVGYYSHGHWSWEKKRAPKRNQKEARGKRPTQKQREAAIKYWDRIKGRERTAK